ncbi:hypothetical protein ACWDBP_43650 [Streptomyces sp. NPDC001233]
MRAEARTASNPHDGGDDRSQTVAALRLVLPRLLDAGYQFGTP